MKSMCYDHMCINTFAGIGNGMMAFVTMLFFCEYAKFEVYIDPRRL